MTEKLSAEEQLAYLASLKEEAALLGMEVAGNIKAESLAKRIDQFKKDKEAEKSEKSVKEAPKKEVATATVTSDTANILKRVIITCHDPSKSTLEGIVIGGGNSKTGLISKYVKFGEAWHVPQILINVLLRKEYTLHYQAKNPHTREMETRNKQVPAYSIQYLPDLSPEELKTLAKKQALHADNKEAE